MNSGTNSSTRCTGGPDSGNPGPDFGSQGQTHRTKTGIRNAQCNAFSWYFVCFPGRRLHSATREKALYRRALETKTGKSSIWQALPEPPTISDGLPRWYRQFRQTTCTISWALSPNTLLRSTLLRVTGAHWERAALQALPDRRHAVAHGHLARCIWGTSGAAFQLQLWGDFSENLA